MSVRARLAGVLAVSLAMMVLITPTFAQGQANVQIHTIDDTQFPTLTVVASVVDGNGRPITGLTASDFIVLEDGIPASLRDAQPVVNTDLGIAVVVGIDVSTSMAGYPLNATRQAATAFIDSLAPADEVAVLAFADTVRVVQNFTTDKEAAKVAINELAAGGRTALYDGAFHSVQLAANSSLSRHMVVLLSDANEYGQLSLASRGDAFVTARDAAVPVYTIALGASVDEAYMRELATLTGGEMFVAPTPAQLAQRYGEVTELLRNQYVLTVDSGVLGDGSQHALTVRLANSGAQASRSFTSRAVAPQFTVNGLEAGQVLSERTTVTLSSAGIGSTITSVSYTVDGQAVLSASQAPFALIVDPHDLISGSHSLTVEGQDAAGNVGRMQVPFEVPMLPPTISLPILTGAESLSEAVVLEPEVSSQSPVRQVTYTIDGSPVHTISEAPYRYTLNPADLSAGDHTLTVVVEDQSGQQASARFDFGVGSAPINLLFVGIGVVAVVLFTLTVLALAGVALALRRRPVVTTAAAQTTYQDDDFDAWLTVDLGGDQQDEYYALTKDRVVVGRSPRCDFVLHDDERYVSREHAIVYRQDARYLIEDLNSTRGTTINGRHLQGVHVLTNGDEIRMGGFILRFQQLVYDEDMEVTRVQPTEESLLTGTQVAIKTDPLEEKERRAARGER